MNCFIEGLKKIISESQHLAQDIYPHLNSKFQTSEIDYLFVIEDLVLYIIKAATEILFPPSTKTPSLYF